VRTAQRSALAAVAVIAVVSSASVSSSPTFASWLEHEWAAASVGVVDCATPEGVFTSQGEGALLGGDLLGVDLADVAEARGMLVTNDSAAATPHPGTAAPAGPDAWANPLDVVALRAAEVSLGQLLQLPLNNATGVLSQYGRADIDGRSTGASGLVSDSGAIATAPGNEASAFAELSVTKLLDGVNAGTGDALADVTDVTLETGAVAASASLDACAAAFEGETRAVTRQYLASTLATEVESPTVGALGGGAAGTLAALTSAVDGVAGNGGVVNSITGGVTALLSGLLTDGLGLGTPTATVTTTIDPVSVSALSQFLTEGYSDPEGIVSVAPGTGSVRVDTVALLSAAYPDVYTDGLNGLPPNTELLIDATIVSKLTTALSSAVSAWLAEVQRLLDAVLDAVKVNAAVTVPVRLCLVGCVNAGSISATVSASLGALLSGTVKAPVNTGGLLGAVLGMLLDPLVDAVVGPLTNGLGLIVGKAVHAVLAPVAVLPNLTTALNALIGAVSGVFKGLYLNGVLSIRVNNQSGMPGAPPEWSSLPAGRYDVSALRIGVLDARDSVLTLHLARGSVGPNCSVASGCLTRSG